MSAIERFDKAVADQMAINGGSRNKAIRHVATTDKELHAAYLAEQKSTHLRDRQR